MTDLATPRALNHIGLTVPDIHAAIDWYGRVFGFRRIMGRLWHIGPVHSVLHGDRRVRNRLLAAEQLVDPYVGGSR